MCFRAKIKEIFIAKSGGSGSDCGPSMHRHPDAYGGKCHSIYQKHIREQVGPNKSPNSQIKKTIKQLKVD